MVNCSKFIENKKRKKNTKVKHTLYSISAGRYGGEATTEH